MNFLEKIAQNFIRYREQPAFVIDGESYTYEAFSRMTGGIIKRLEEEGFKQGDRALVVLNDDVQTYAAIFAVWFAGGTMVPVNPTHPGSRNLSVIRQVRPAYVLSHHASHAGWAAHFISLAGIKPAPVPEEFPFFEEDLLYILFTSGSTGVPKGVMITRDNMQHYLDNHRRLLPGLRPGMRYLQMLELTFDGSLQTYLMPLVEGGTVYHVDSGKVKYLEALRLMKEYGIEYVKTNNSTLFFLRPFFDRISLPELKYCLFSGEGLQEHLIREWMRKLPHVRNFNVYGPTECTVNTLAYPIRDEADLERNYHGIIAIGTPFGENRVRICHPDGSPVETGETGEICLAGGQVSPGYWEDAEKTAAAFVTIDGERYYRTGDYGFTGPEGIVYFAGRRDNQVKFKGYRIELQELESHAVRYYSGCRYVAVITGGEVQQLVLAAEGEVDVVGLTAFLRNALPAYMVPDRVEVVDAFPLTANGKIDKNRLREMITRQ